MKCWYKGKDYYSYILELDRGIFKERMYFSSYEEMIEYVRENNELEPQNFIA